MNFFFVYDTAFCKSDEDDPKDAVVLFFPAQASESQGHFLCCQLAGVAKFLKSTFSAPAVIGLDQAKFAFFWSGNYLLGLGANSDVNESALKDQLVFLCGIFCFYHGNMGNILKECKNNRYDFLLKLELSWSRYVSLTQGFGNGLQMPVQSLPMKTGKKGSNGAASRLLHLCQLSSSATTGAVFYNSRVLATQFTPQLTNYLSLLSNSNASAPVSDVHPKIPLPPDVELKHVYLSPKSPVRCNNTPCGGAKRVEHRRRANTVGGSGSEGDVDSGGNLESVRCWDWKWRQCVSRLDSSISCCISHSRLFKRRLSATRNKYFWKETRRKDSQVSPKVDSKQASSYGAVSLPCPSHSQQLYGTLPSRQHSELTSSADAEFRCSFCRSYIPSTSIRNLKRWNSDPEMCFPTVRMEEQKHDTSFLAPSRHRSVSDTTHKIKKNRLKVDSHFQRRHSKANPAKSHTAKDACVNIEENDLKKHVLYVQRYGSCTLVLLLGRHYDEKAINYLWNCGFSVLRELELSSERPGDESPYNIEPSFYILLYNHMQRVFKEYPHFPSLLFTEKHSRQTIQKIQAEFKMDPKFLTICLLSSNYSVFAFHKDANLAFYLQPESNARKLDPLLHLQSKAVRRLAKYFKVNPV